MVLSRYTASSTLFLSNPSGIGFSSHIEAAERPCSAWRLPRGCQSIGLSDDELVLFPLTPGDGFGGTFDFTFGAILGGLLEISDGTTDVRMQSVGPLWTIEHTGSDGPGICFDNDGRCWGSTGLWVLDLSTIPTVSVPEPSTSYLMFVAVTLLLGSQVASRRRRVTSTSPTRVRS